MSLEEAVRKVDFKDNDLKGKVREMALMLRKGGRKAIRTQSLCEDVIVTTTISTARFVATMTRTDTLHDTVGIAYQARFKDNIDVRNELTIENKITEQLIDFNRNLDVTSASSQVTKKIKRRRA